MSTSAMPPGAAEADGFEERNSGGASLKLTAGVDALTRDRSLPVDVNASA